MAPFGGKKKQLKYQPKLLSLFPSAVLTASGSKGIISVRKMDTPKVVAKLQQYYNF